MTAPAHPEVIELLEAYLDLARHNSFGHVAISMVGHPGVAVADFAGEISLEESQQEAWGLLGKRLDASIDNWAFPPQDDDLDASYVRYNVANGPLGYDFLCWLVDAEMTRVRQGAPAPLKVAFWCGRDPERTMKTDKRAMWVENVFRPSLALIGAVEDERALYGHNKPVFVARDIVKAAKEGEAVPRFKSPAVSPVEPGAVTITLREADHDAHRNSDIKAWRKFCGYLLGNGERVIIVRDTAKMFQPFYPFETCPAASSDLHARVALYESAKANLFVSNGPATIGFYSEYPWLEFVKTDQPGWVDTPEFWTKLHGLTPPHDQFPWSRSDQRIVWKQPSYENIVEAWEEHIAPVL